jgi:hypothetical protein
MINKKGQVTIFIILAIVLVVGVVIFFVYRDSIISESIPVSIEPAYASFLSCLEEYTLTGIDVLESQGGYIVLPDFEQGSEYMPFSSQLNFLGNPIPYWYYVSGNNIQKEQVPSKNEMENQLEEFINKKINGCVFDYYYEQGFEISLGQSDTNVVVRENEVEIDLNMDLNINKEEDSALIRNHKIVVKSKLGTLYDSAKKIYEYEQDNLFLENYAVDTLRLYAPVDGVELTCSPLTWEANKIFDELQEAIEVNTLSLKLKGGDYSLRNEENKYFIIDFSVDADVRFINSKEWVNSFEVAPSEESILLANPVGNQPGLGILGFCYIPYHFVYNIKYPVLVQLSNGEETFQFPVAVVVQNNKPRKTLDVSAVEMESSGLCNNKNTLVEVNVYDSKLNLVDADISYECFGEVCNIGKTEQGNLEEEFPQCANGYILVKAEGFEKIKYMYSTTGPGSIDIILDKFYEKEIELKLDGNNYQGNAMINFISDEASKTIIYPEQKTLKLREGQYEIQVYIYKDSDLKLEETIYEQCVEVPQTGFGSLLGLTQNKCFDVKIPSQVISNVLAGGGNKNYYVLGSELETSNVIEINVGSLDLPKTIEELQDNYLLVEDKELEVYFR